MGLMTRPDLWPTKQGLSASSLCSSSEETKTHTDVLKSWDFNGFHDDVRAFWGDPNIWDRTWKTYTETYKSANVESLTICCIYCHRSQGLKHRNVWPSVNSALLSRGIMGGEVWMPDLYHKRRIKRSTALKTQVERRLNCFPTSDVQTLNTKCFVSLLMLIWRLMDFIQSKYRNIEEAALMVKWLK